MRQLLQSTHACTLLKAERTEGRLNHAYLLIFDDARNLKTALKEFSKIFFGADGEGADAERISRLIDEENFSDCMFFSRIGEKIFGGGCGADHRRKRVEAGRRE